MRGQPSRAQLLGVANLTIAIISGLVYVGHGLIWVDDVWARNSYPPASCSSVILGYYAVSLALALLLLLAGLGLWDGQHWGRWASYLYSTSTLLLQGGFYALGVLLAPDRPDWLEVVKIGFVVSGIYAALLLELLALGYVP